MNRWATTFPVRSLLWFEFDEDSEFSDMNRWLLLFPAVMTCTVLVSFVSDGAKEFVRAKLRKNRTAEKLENIIVIAMLPPDDIVVVEDSTLRFHSSSR